MKKQWKLGIPHFASPNCLPSLGNNAPTHPPHLFFIVPKKNRNLGTLWKSGDSVAFKLVSAKREFGNVN